MAPSHRPWLLALVVGTLYFGALHLMEPRLADYDGYFHVRFASLGPAAWLGREFPWMPFGVFEGGRFVDHQWLFHALIWPFTLALPLLDAAHASAAVFAGVAMAGFAWLLGDRGARHPALWAAALLGASRFFDDRLLMPRTQALSLGLLFVGIGLALRGRTRALLLLGVVFAWTYHVAIMLIPCALVAGLASARGPLAPRLAPAAAAAAGVFLGLLAHPQSPYTFEFLWVHVVEKVLNPTGQAVGAEWMPVDTRTWLVHMAPVVALGAWGVWGVRRAAADTRALAFLAAGWLFASAGAVKWLEYAVPFSFAALALLWRDNRRSPAVLLPFFPLALLNGVAVLDHVRTTVPPADRLANLAAALPATDCAVFHADWTDFSELVYHAPQCSYIVGLDPHFLAAGDPKRADLVEAALAGRVERLGDMAADAFGAGWVLATSEPMLSRAAADPRLELVRRDEAGGLWKVR
jgi:hypothetical protein